MERAALSVRGHTANSLNIRAKLNRQLAARKEQLAQLSRESSVILPVSEAEPATSTPNLSPNLTQTQAFFSPDVSISIPPVPTVAEPGLDFEIFQDSSQNPLVNPVQKIPVVDTPSTVFSGADKENLCAFQFGPAITVSEYEYTAPQEPEEATSYSVDLNMEEEVIREAIKKFGRTCNKLKDFCNSHQVDKTPARLLVHHEVSWLRKVEEMYLLLLDEAEEFDLEDDSNLSEAQRNKVKNLKQDIVRFVSNYNLTYSTRMMEAMNLAGSASLSSSDPASRAASHASEERYRRTVAEVEVDAERISADIEALRKEVMLVDDWSDATDHQVEVNVEKTADWKKRMRQLWEVVYKMKTAVRSHDLDDGNLQNAERAVKVMEAEVENAIENLLHEDEARCLYSQSKRKTANRKYPKFSGADEKQEDFQKFEKDVREVFKSNRIARDDQVKKLREECLESPAKNLIPETVKTLDRALEILRGRYGGISNLIKVKKGKLLKMGIYPNHPGSKAAGHVKAQLKWLLTCEVVLAEITELAAGSTEAHREVYNFTVLQQVRNFFPGEIHEQFLRFTGPVENIFAEIYEEVLRMSKAKRELLTDVDDNEQQTNKGKKGNAASFSADSSRRPESFLNKDCRICKTLEAEGVTDNLYEDHARRSVIGCPLFAEMSAKERMRIIQAAKICSFCLDHKFVRSSKLHPNCPAFEGNPHYQCKANGCKKHYLVCTDHIRENEMKKEGAAKFWSSRGKTFSAAVTVMNVGGKVAGAHNSVVELSLKEATESLKSMAKGSKVLDLPEGDPLFMFSYIPGRTKDLNVFWDCGCSHLMMKSDVPEKELAAVRTRKGPLMIKGAGDTDIEVGDEWIILVPKADGTQQILIGVTSPQITAPFPVFNTKEAFQEVLHKAPHSKKKMIAKMKVPPQVGGDADLLVGIYFQNLYPELIYQLPCGLTISKTKLSPSSKGYNAVLGGPHSSFVSLCNQVGGSTHLMSCFISGLQSLKALGAPKIPSPPVTSEEEIFAQMMNRGELAQFVDPEEVIIDEEFALDGGPVAGDIDVDEDAHQDDHRLGSLILCGQCGIDILESPGEVAGVADVALETEYDPNLCDLKTLMKMNEDGITVDYKCPKCRNCESCKNPFDTERISQREEVEDEAIKESVVVDRAAKKITARLPFRGDENQYLSNNRQVALKILDGQCAKLKNDEEGRMVILKAFKKLTDNGFAVKFDDLTEDEKKMIESKPLQHYLPWRAVYKVSVSSPCRAVFDASAKCPVTKDGRGGRCLNDITMKGVISTLDLMQMLLRFCIGKVAVTGDLKMFYTSIHLHPEQWHLQRVLFRDNLDLDSEAIEMIIRTLIFGVKPVSALSERALLMLADLVNNDHPRLAEMIRRGRFVDDLADSDKNEDIIKELTDDADKLFESVGLSCKGWSRTGSPPHPDVTDDGLGLDVGGLRWQPQLDTLQVKIPPLHFGKKVRGKLLVGTEIFDGNFGDLCSFVPERLTRRQVVSKFASVFDPYGKLCPVTAAMKHHCRMAVMETEGWDDPITQETRTLWLKNFWQLHSLKGVMFMRARIPEDAASTDLTLVCAVDAANQIKAAGVYARFPRKNGKFSSQLLVGRSLLAKEGSSIPKEELEAAVIGSNLLWIVRKSLDNLVTDYMLVSDSTIALSWVTNDTKKLSLFHRNRANQIKMHTATNKLFHVISECNPADVVTRAEKVGPESVGPESIWENGHEWMKDTVEAAINAGILKPVDQLRMMEKEEEDYEKGFLFEKTPELLVHGHVSKEVFDEGSGDRLLEELEQNQLINNNAVSADTRVEKMAKRAAYSRYIIQPSKYDFRKIVRITGYVFKFIRLCKFKRLAKADKTFKMFPACFITWGTEKPPNTPDGKNEPPAEPSHDDLSRALKYWMVKATKEVIEFNDKEVVMKKGVKGPNGVLYSRSRLDDSHRFIVAGDFPADSIGRELGLNVMAPLIDRWSPIAYSIGLFIHDIVARHAGYETCNRMSLNYVYIIQGATLYKEMGAECSECHKIRKKYLDAVFGNISDNQLTLAPPFYIAHCDIAGPYTVYVPGHERETRNRRELSSKCYLMVFVCPFSKLLNIQVIESKNAEGVLEGLCRLACEAGMPAKLVLDQDTAFMKMIRDAEVNLKDLSHRAFKEYGIEFETAPVAGHNWNGLAERKIKTIKESFAKMSLENHRLHATGLATFCKLVESNINSTPIGYGYGRDADNNGILKIITPNILRMGRINSRSLTGPIKYPKGPSDLLKKVEETYDCWFNCWNTAYVPRMIPTPKWYKDSPELKPGDIVYFQKVEALFRSPWTVGEVDTVTRSRDDKVRRVSIKYYNHKDDKIHYTDRSVRSVAKLFHIEDSYFAADMAECERMVAAMEKNDVETNDKFVRTEDGSYDIALANLSYIRNCNCCCSGHCRLLQSCSSKKKESLPKMFASVAKRDFPQMLDRMLDNATQMFHTEAYSYERDMIDHGLPMYEVDSFSKLLCATETCLDWDGPELM